MNKSKGAVLFAHNNTEIDYIAIAAFNALLIKKNLGLPVQLVTDTDSISLYTGSLDMFDVVTQVDDTVGQNFKVYRDADAKTLTLPFRNISRIFTYDYSVFEETIMLDADYFVFTDALNACFGSNQNIMLNKEYREILHDRRSFEKKIANDAISLYWATAIYFNRSSESEFFFNKVKDVYAKYDYYRRLYMLPNNMFRNDFAFSIAAHEVSGFCDGIASLPNTSLLKSIDLDDISKVTPRGAVFLAASSRGTIPVKVENCDVHVMNKWAIIRNLKEWEQLIQLDS